MLSIIALFIASMLLTSFLLGASKQVKCQNRYLKTLLIIALILEIIKLFYVSHLSANAIIPADYTIYQLLTVTIISLFFYEKVPWTLVLIFPCYILYIMRYDSFFNQFHQTVSFIQLALLTTFSLIKLPQVKITKSHLKQGLGALNGYLTLIIAINYLWESNIIFLITKTNALSQYFPSLLMQNITIALLINCAILIPLITKGGQNVL